MSEVEHNHTTLKLSHSFIYQIFSCRAVVHRLVLKASSHKCLRVEMSFPRRLLMGFTLLLAAFSASAVEDELIPLSQMLSLEVFTGPMDAVDFSHDGRFLASGGRDHAIRVWNAESGELLTTSIVHEDWVTTVAFHPDDTWIVSGSRDNSVRLIDTASGEQIKVIGHHRGDVTSLAFTPDGTILATGARDGAIELYHMPSAELITEIENFGGAIWDLRFDPSGKILAAASDDGSIWIYGFWDEAGAWVNVLKNHAGAVTSLAFSPDGGYLLSSGLDGTMQLWAMAQVRSAELVMPELILRGHLAPVMGLGFTADASIVASASLDGSVRLWDIGGAVERGKALIVVSGSGAPLTNLAMNNAHTVAASVGTDGVLNLWNLEEEQIASIVARFRPAPPVAAVAPNRGTGTSSSQGTELVPPASERAPSPSAGGRSIRIPSIGVQSAIKVFPLDGVSWAIDPWDPLVGHLQGTAWLDRVGNIALGGHSEYPDGRPGIFYRLQSIGIGDEIFIRDGDNEFRYVVINTFSVDYRDVSVVFPTSQHRLTLITCDIPSYVAEQNWYYERLVVQADRVP